MSEIDNTWKEYRQLVLSELQRLNGNYDKLVEYVNHQCTDFNNRISAIENLVKDNEELMKRLTKVEKRVESNEDAVNLARWFASIVGGAILLAVVQRVLQWAGVVI
jgi:SMC interacting uncharacterized protein involved in chromosome segregation